MNDFTCTDTALEKTCTMTETTPVNRLPELATSPADPPAATPVGSAPSASITVGKKQVFLAMPSYNGVASETFRAAHFLAAGLKDGDYPYGVMISERSQCSLLAFGFNQLWADCANATDVTYDYWGMLHADLCPSGLWLEVMIEEMEKYDLDVIHAPAAIKDARGVTSTAVGRWDDRWGTIRKISATELQALPETFTIHDLPASWSKHWDDEDGADKRKCRRAGYCLLPNTGCLLVRLRKDGKADPRWRRFRGFEINDRLGALQGTTGEGTAKRQHFIVPVEDPAWNGDGRIVAQVAPEDWNFGRWCAAQGLRVGGTRKVTTQHFGRGVYQTDKAWGTWAKDEMSLDFAPQ